MAFTGGAAPGQTENLAELENLNEESLLSELRTRFNKDIIYTYVGEILVTVNPFKWIPGIYDPSVQAKYNQLGDKKRERPHLFAVSDTAFQNMVNGKENQVCVISGESGAGKTEAAKLFVRHLITVCPGTEFDGLEKKLVQVNPLLEAFGNAQTLMNDNSSRFGKFTEVRFNSQGVIKGAFMRHYLLEKSRVVHQGQGEQNFHVFYLFFAGMDATERARFELKDPSEHRVICTNVDALANIKSSRMKEMHKELIECMNIVGFSEDQKEDMFHVLAGTILLADVEFDGEDAAQIVSQNLTSVCNQLGIDETALELSLTKSVNVIRGEETERAYRQHEADDCRDAAVKAIYEYLFTWIFSQCNNMLGPKEKTPAPGDTMIGILDIFGFECFESNSFEQLCINLANEQLQSFFNNHIFAMELAEYAKEGITGKHITYENNQALLDLILQNKPLGLLGIVDEEALVPKGTDESMVQKFHAAFAKMKDYERPRGSEAVFTLRHYAGKVTYDGVGFLEKNRDTLAVDVIGAFRLSENSLLKELFGGDEVAKRTGKKFQPAARRRLDRGESKKNMRMSMKKARDSLTKKKKVTVATLFKASLNDLMMQLNSAAPHFVRCVKPNMLKKPAVYDNELVLKQLRYTGMLETTRIRREGYSYRPTFQDFMKRYYMLGFPLRSNPPPTGAACQTVLQRANISGYEIGKTKVFLRYFHVDELNEKLLPIGHAAIVLSKAVRAVAARCKHARALAAKRAQDQKLGAFFQYVEKNCAGTHDVVMSLCDEDNRRPATFWNAPAAEASKDAGGKKLDTIARKGMQRAASVRWFKEVEKKKGAGQTNEGFADWFFGVITRKESEDRLANAPNGTYLIRVAESRFGYSLSMSFKGRIKHFMIDQDNSGNYVVVGNDRLFASLNEIVAHHKRHPVTDEGDLLTVPCKADGPRADLDELS